MMMMGCPRETQCNAHSLYGPHFLCCLVAPSLLNLPPIQSFVALPDRFSPHFRKAISQSIGGELAQVQETHQRNGTTTTFALSRIKLLMRYQYTIIVVIIINLANTNTTTANTYLHSPRYCVDMNAQPQSPCESSSCFNIIRVDKSRPVVDLHFGPLAWRGSRRREQRCFNSN